MKKKRVDDKITDKPEPRTMVWDEDTKKVFLEMNKQTVSQTVQHVFSSLGVDPAVHREQHLMFLELIPWIQAQRKKTMKQAEFWESLISENFRRSVNIAVWLLVVAAALGLSGAWRLIVPLIGVP